MDQDDISQQVKAEPGLHGPETSFGLKYDIATNKVSTVAGGNGPGFGGDNGPAIGAILNNPNSIAIDAEGKTLFIGAKENNRTTRRKRAHTSGLVLISIFSSIFFVS